MLHHNLE